MPFVPARCVRVRQKLVPRNLSATHNLAPDIRFRSIITAEPAIARPLFLIHSTGRPGNIENSQLVFSKMPDNRKQTGRPKMAEGKRTKKVTARFTEDEYKTIRGLEETLGISKTDLVRERLLHGARLTMINAKELISELTKAGTELGRSGNNINQLARYANMLNKKNVLSPQVIEAFNLLFAKHLENRRELEVALRKIIRSLGK